MKWNSVEDCMPNKKNVNAHYLVITKYEKMGKPVFYDICHVDAKSGCFLTVFDFNYEPLDNVVYWMKIEPPDDMQYGDADNV